MYAIIETGGTQHRVQEGETIRVNDPNLPVGQEVTFSQVKLFSDGQEVSIGRPNLSDVTVTGIVKKVIRGKKIRITKYRRRKHSATRHGHRQNYSVVRINRISRAQTASESQASTVPASEGLPARDAAPAEPVTKGAETSGAAPAAPASESQKASGDAPASS
ncbi:MAG: 50S ribosomal protein L21 [Planctomycetes bacterium]|nr:50S ribosomal protein L21 [Planctomycetota bacterium]